MRSSTLLPLLLLAFGVCYAQSSEAVDIAARNARQASEAFLRSNRVMHAWLDRVDPVTGLLPRRGDDPNWVVKDSAADLYPFLVIAAYFTEPAQYEGAMRRILRRETLLTTRVGRLSDDLLPGGKGFVFPDADLDRIIFGSSEYIKDGLLPITELLGETPWYHRLRGIATDIVRHAPYSSPRGRLPAQSAEVNGNMLQVLSRLYWKTSDEAYLKQAIAIADTYFLDILPATNYIPPDQWDIEMGKPQTSIFRLSDHGNEIVGGLAEVCFLAVHKRHDRAKRYREAFLRMIDRLLEVGRNADGVWITTVDLTTGKPVDQRPVHCWGYLYKPVYVAYLLSGEVKYKRAVADAMASVTRKQEYLFDDSGAGRGWGANAYSDSIESALVLLNRLPGRRFEKAIDVAARKMFDRQGENGIVEDWYGDGNFIRTALMYAFWKTQGSFLMPWNPRVHIGAVRQAGGVLLHISAESPWQGRLRFDHARHRNHFNIADNYPRLNEFPEWFTVEHDRLYRVRTDDGDAREYLGAELIAGIPLSLEAGEKTIVKVVDGGEAPYGNK